MMPEIVSPSPTVDAIYAHYVEHRGESRGYLGSSSIGKPCERALWYEFRWCGGEEFSGRMLRLFETGQVEEARVVQNLKDIGCEVFDKDESGNQFEIKALDGHFGGHCDGVVTGLREAPKTPHVLEIKTHNAKSFAALVKNGVEVHKPEHVAQMQSYMLGLDLERACYIAVNKDTDEIFLERLGHDPKQSADIMAKATRIVDAKEPPPKIGMSRDDFACKWCNHQSRCHGPVGEESAVPITITCRNCCHASPIRNDPAFQDGNWRCEKYRKVLTPDEQRAACDSHLVLPGLVTFAKAINGSDEHVNYKNEADGQEWANGGPTGWDSVELTQVTIGGMVDPLVKAVKEKLGGKVVKT